MKVYRFVAKVSDSGTIQIPYDSSLLDEEVEVVIRSAPHSRSNRRPAAAFVNQWAGFLAGDDTEQSNYECLSRKYQR